MHGVKKICKVVSRSALVCSASNVTNLLKSSGRSNVTKSTGRNTWKQALHFTNFTEFCWHYTRSLIMTQSLIWRIVWLNNQMQSFFNCKDKRRLRGLVVEMGSLDIKSLASPATQTVTWSVFRELGFFLPDWQIYWEVTVLWFCLFVIL